MQQDSLFFKSSLYVCELCEPVSLTEFNEPALPLPEQEQMESLCESPITPAQATLPPKVPNVIKQSKPIIQKNNSNNDIHKKEQKSEVTSRGKKFIIKKYNSDDDEKSIQCLPNLPRGLSSQVKLFRNTATKQSKQKINKFIINQQKQQQILQEKYQPITLPTQFATFQNNNFSIQSILGNGFQQQQFNNYQSGFTPQELPLFDLNFLKSMANLKNYQI